MVDIVLSHNGVALKSDLLLRLMNALVLPAPDLYRPQLRRLAALSEHGSADVAQRAQQLLEHSLLVSGARSSLADLPTVFSQCLAAAAAAP